MGLRARLDPLPDVQHRPTASPHPGTGRSTLECLKGGGHHRPGTGGVELGCKLGKMLRPTRVGQRPPARAGEPGPLHPAERLEVLEGRQHLTTIQGEPGRDPALVGETERPHGMQHQQGRRCLPTPARQGGGGQSV